MMRRIVSCETPYAAATVRSDSFCSTKRCTTVGHSEAGIPYVGFLALVAVCRQSEEGLRHGFHRERAILVP